MADASLFLRKRKDKVKQKHSVPSHAPSPSHSDAPSPAPTPNSIPSKASPAVKTDGSITEFKLFSTGVTEGLRYNLMKLNSGRDVDPTKISRPILLNRKQPGPKPPPAIAVDAHGKPIGKYIYDESGKPVIGPNGQPSIEESDEMDMSLVGVAPGEQKRKGKKGVKEVYNQDIEVMRLRREENTPWVLESGNPVDKSNIPEHWVGRMMEPSAMPTVLLINDGRTEGFSVVSLGRTYRFEPERPFKVLDPDAAHKLV